MPLTAEILRAVAPQAEASIVEGILAHEDILARYGITKSPLRLAHFLAQTAHESAHFRTTREYASGDAYEGRKDLGNTRPGDGRRFRGRGLIQMTGRANYTRAARETGEPLVDRPALLEKFPLALEASCLYWKWRGLNALADRDDVRGITLKINGGLNGYADRQAKLARAKRALGETTHDVVPDDDGEHVAALQRDLVALGYHLGRVDGKFGRLTRDALMAFQADWDGKGSPLTTDGIAGPKTREAIRRARRSGWTRPAARRDVTADDLAAAGSETIDAAKTGRTTAGGIGAGGAIIAAERTLDAAERANDWAERLSAMAPWLIGGVLVAGAAWLIWRQYGRIIAARVRDAATGAHRGR